MAANPFTPSFGQPPLILAGRDYIVRDIVHAFENGIGDPNLSTLFVGARGTGKTALLTHLSEKALAHGWVCSNVSAVPGMLDDVLIQARENAQHLLPHENAARLTSLAIGGIAEFSWERAHGELQNWRSKMNEVLDRLSITETGLLITVDEVRVDFPEMVEFASVYQHFVRERRKVALLMAGLPHHVSELLGEKSISFLRRSMSHQLGRIGDGDVALALRETVEQGGRSIEKDALDIAVAASAGFPFMMQLVGYRSWEAASDKQTITHDDVVIGVERARLEMRGRILETTFNELSDGDIRFLEAMLDDEAESNVSDISFRLGVSSGYASQYRKRLLEQGVIGIRGRGKVAFELPGWRAFFEEKIGKR